MSDEAGSGRVLGFGPFEWGPALRVLVAHADRVVTRDQLRRELWGDETFVDFEQGLNTAIARLRQALGDSAEHPRFIETMPGRGYRFIAEIRSPRSEAELIGVPGPPATIDRRTWLAGVWASSLGRPAPTSAASSQPLPARCRARRADSSSPVRPNPP